MTKKLPKHIVRLVSILGFFVVAALILKSILTDPSFYRYGHFRADAVPELASGEPRYKGSAFCIGCHEQRGADWMVNKHVAVQCEVCHGPDLGCPENGKAMLVGDTIRLCSQCHESMPARPAQQPQIVLAEHPFPDEETPQCVTCHDPHAPSNEEPPLAIPVAGEAVVSAVAEVPDVVEKCARCHGKHGHGRNQNPPLAGMEAEVFIEKMQQFKSGEVESKRMARYAEPLSDEEIERLASYYQALPALSDEGQPEK